MAKQHYAAPPLPPKVRPEEFAIALRTARAARGFSKDELAVRSGVPALRLQRIERGVRVPSPTEWAKLWGCLSTM